jgi:hypothetical protein
MAPRDTSAEFPALVGGGFRLAQRRPVHLCKPLPDIFDRIHGALQQFAAAKRDAESPVYCTTTPGVLKRANPLRKNVPCRCVGAGVE